MARKHAVLLACASMAATCLAAAALTVSLTRTASGETSCTRLVYQYLTTLAAADGITVSHFKMLACRKAGNLSVARVSLLVRQVLVNPWTGQTVTQTVPVVLSLRLEKSPWQVVATKQAS